MRVLSVVVPAAALVALSSGQRTPPPGGNGRCGPECYEYGRICRRGGNPRRACYPCRYLCWAGYTEACRGERYYCNIQWHGRGRRLDPQADFEGLSHAHEFDPLLDALLKDSFSSFSLEEGEGVPASISSEELKQAGASVRVSTSEQIASESGAGEAWAETLIMAEAEGEAEEDEEMDMDADLSDDLLDEDLEENPLANHGSSYSDQQPEHSEYESEDEDEEATRSSTTGVRLCSGTDDCYQMGEKCADFQGSSEACSACEVLCASGYEGGCTGAGVQC
uniref:TNFR-Cys domain-containing protein n=1 Tax=Chromera velia CCMP2878 TaxID=1169474 RepID=A0A0G4GDI0_9ALVE|mmetsp:Transcript_11102/g.21428  ORF Transcript_11102/g.21428 Transcript_11102/m.21428 type:complete len:279 (+) Transcript_11102:150-986(+)|eukprot:Cvel_21387.t1-p1 / transcript=Cvel_21387.t1 / gene=Cvel_21387 / organism=Chromera_velia_CCMP2878 / gene_product=hypothetical protein / transcript_product=hypothetical protein / location=Cvel_scaffold2001:28249-29585(+) / protein_length=278 / sequence_SO=supercontig / SO=protein_coding / is_pseudo=false